MSDISSVHHFANEMLFYEPTTVGMQGTASASLTIKNDLADTDTSGRVSHVPGVAFSQITDEGIDLQANWGGMEYLKDSKLN